MANSPVGPDRQIRPWQRIAIVSVGVLIAIAMSVLGYWQAEVYRSQGLDASAARVAEPARALAEAAPPGAPVRDGYGRTVSFSGQYLPDFQLLVGPRPGDDEVRVLTALRTEDGSVIAVVRGRLDPGQVLPAAPTTVRLESGLLLPSEDEPASSPGSAVALTAIRTPSLAQEWPGPLVSGYLTLSPEDAREQGLTPARYRLPDAPGRLRNGAYAIQWWLFAAFAIAMSIKIARDLGGGADPAVDYDVRS